MKDPDSAINTTAPAAVNSVQGVNANPLHLSSILDATHDAFFLIDRNFNLLTYNRAFLQMTQYYSATAPCPGTSIFDVLPPHQKEILTDNFQRVLNGEFVELENMVGKTPRIWMNVNLYPIRENAESEIEGITVCLRDITSRKVAEEEAADLLKKYKSLIENGIDASYQFDLQQYKFIFFSPIIESISGYTPEEITGWNHDEALAFIHPDDLAKFRSSLESGIRTGKINTEYRCRRKDGAYIWVLNRANVITDGSGDPVSSVGSIRDINSQKKAELLQKKSEEEYRALIENSLDASYHFDFQRNEYVYFSPVMSKISGYSTEEIMNWSAEENASHIHPEDAGMVHAEIEHSVKTGRLAVEYRSRKKDGSYIWVSNTANIIRDDKGHPLLGIGTIRDISNKKETETALFHQEEQYRTLVEHASEGILILDTEGKLIEANSHIFELMGYSKDEFAHENLLSHLIIDNSEPALRLGEVLAGFTVVQERKARKKNGELIQVELSSKLLPDFRILVIVRDLSERNKSRQKMEEKDTTFNQLFHFSGEGFFIADDQGLLTDVNEAGCSLLGYKKKELLRRDFQDFIQLEPGQEQLDLESLTPGNSMIFTRKAMKRSGALMTLEIHAIRLADKRLLGITHDITEKRNEHKRIAESEERFRTIFENSIEGIILMEDTGKVIAANPAACRMFGRSETEMKTLTRYEMSPDDLVKMEEMIKLRRLNGNATGQITYTRKDGTTFPAMIATSSFVGPDGIGLVAVNIHDITELKKTEGALLENEALLRKMFDVASIGTIVASSDGKFLKVNNAYCRMLGYTKEELIGMSYLDITHPDDKKISNSTAKKLFSQQTTDFKLEKRYIRKDGRMIWVEISSTALKIANGIAVEVITHITDITARKEAQAALEISERRYKTLFDKSSFGIVIMTPAGKIVTMNEAYAKSHGYTVGEMLRMNMADINVPESRELMASRISRTIAGETLTFEVGHYHKNGQILTFEISPSSVEIGNEMFIQAFIRDITELKKAAETVKATEKRYTTLFEKASVGISFIGEDQKLINVNEAYATMHGYSVEEILKMDVRTLNTPEARNNLDEIGKRIFAGETLQYETEHFHKDGHIIHVEITTSLVILGGQRFIQSFLRDITELKKARLEAFEQGNRYKSLFEESSIGIIIVGEHGQIIGLNQACANIHGYSIEEMKQLNVQQLLPPQDQLLFQNRITEQLSGKTLNFKVNHFHKNGSIRTLDVTGRVHEYNGRKYVQSFMRDITDIMRAEMALAESEIRYKSIFDKAMIGIVITTIEGKIINANKSFAQMLGYEVDEVLKMQIQDMNIPENLPDLEKIIMGIMQNSTGTFETQLYHKSGERRTIDISASRVKFGNDDFILAFHWDITEDRKNRKELMMKDNAIASSISGMGMADLNGNIFYANHTLCQMWGAKKPEELIGMNLTNVFEGTRVYESIKALQTRGFEQGEDTGKKLDGTLFPVEFSANVLLDSDGNPVCMFGSFLDISVRKKAEERLRKKFTQISALAELSEIVGKSRKLEEVFNVTIETVMRTISADKVAILLKDENEMLNYAASANISEGYKKILVGHSSRPVLERDMTPKLISDVEQEPMLKKHLPMIRKEKIRSMGFFPLVHKGKLLGKMVVYYTQPHHFSVGELHLAETIGRDVAFSIYEKNEQIKLVSEKEFSDSIINSLPGIFYVWDKDLKILRWNMHFEEVSGYQHDEISGMNPILFIAEEDREFITGKILNVLSSGSARAEGCLLTKDRRKIPYFFTAVKVTLNGQTCIVGNGIDISERKKSELALIESELRYRSLINQANDLIILSDEHANIIEINEVVKPLLGYKREEVIGKSSLQYYSDEDVDQIPAQIKRLMAGASILIERKLKHKNGKLIDVELNSKMLPGKKILTFARDIRERKKTEAALLNERNLSESTINNLPGIFYLFDESGFLIRWNRNFELMSGYKNKDLKKMRIVEFYDDDMKLIIEKTMKQGIKKNIGGFETNVNRKDGTKVPFLFISKPILYEGKNCVIGIGMDVSKQKKIEEELIKSYTQIRQLTEHLQIVREEERAYLAREVHDVLGQQLTVLKMDMAWLKSKLASKDTEFKERMTGMDDMMDETIKTVRQISSDLRSGVLDNFGFAAAIEWQSMEFRKKTGIHVNFFDETDGLKIPQKQSMGLFRIFQECLTNIARHAKATKVDISLKRDAGELHLQIRDNGKGFNTKKMMEKKTLGLIGMQERTKIIHGNITINSKPGNGTTVELSIPEKELTEH